MGQDNPKGFVNESGALHIVRLNDVASSYLTCHSGVSRPSYAEAGTIWLDTTATPWVLKQYSGSVDISLGTVNASTNLFQASSAANADTLDTYHAANTTGAVPISNGTVNVNLNAEQHNGLKVKVMDIGDWDMDADGSVSVAHGLTLGNIRRVTASVRSDTGTLHTDGKTDELWINQVDTTNVVITRKGGGFFDGAAFDATSYNRGWIVIEYIP